MAATQYSLRAKFASLLSSYSNYDIGWVQFIRDHYYHIKSKASLVQLNPFVHNSMKYRLADFLADNNIPTEMGWIVLMINQLASEADFSDLTFMILPDTADIIELRNTYDSITSHKKRVEEES